MLVILKLEANQAIRQNASSESAAATSHRKSSIIAKLKRLLPGVPNSIMAIQGESGEVTSDPEQMAAALRSRWEKIFKRPGIDQLKLQRWLESLPVNPAAANQPNLHQWHGNQSLAGEAQNGTTCAALPRDARAWKVSRKDIEKALRCSGNSSPGPDGISFAIWLVKVLPVVFYWMLPTS